MKTDSLLRTNKEVTEIYERTADTIYRICYTYMKNESDTRDMVQDTYLKLIQHHPDFESLQHEKAWLIVTASNLCKDHLKHWWQHRENIDDHEELSAAASETNDVLNAVLSLPVKYKLVVYLHYYDGYTTNEISSMLHISASTIRSQLVAARNLLKLKLGGEYND